MAGSISKYETKTGFKYMVVLEVGIDPVTGKRKQKRKKGFKTKKEANAYLSEAQVAINNGYYIESTDLTFGKHIMDWVKLKDYKPQTLQTNTYNINKWVIPNLGKIKMSSLTPKHMTDFVSLMKDHGLKPASIQRIFILVKDSLNYAVDIDVINKNPALKIMLPSIKSSETYIWNKEEVGQFFEAAESMRSSLYMTYYLAYYTGCRQSEILGLSWDNVNFEENYIKIDQATILNGKEISKDLKTESSRRIIGLPDFVMDKLREHKVFIDEQKEKYGADYSDLNLVCCSKLGNPLDRSHVRERMKQVADSVGLPHMKFHGFRHLHGSLLLEKGVNIKKISSRLGHANANITLKVYSHVTESMEKEVLSKLEDITKTH